MPIKNLIFSNEEKKIEAFISDLIIKIKIILQTKTNVVIALSGGKSPINLLKRLSLAEIDWSKITITLVDDRIVDNNSINSNQKLLMDNLFVNSNVKAKFIGLVDLNLSPTDMVLNAEKIPPIDIVVLGMGDDGHTASIFPDCDELNDALNDTYPYNYIVTKPKLHDFNRIGLSLKAIKQIPYKYIVIKGSERIKLLKQAIEKKDPSIPISYLFEGATQNIFILQHF